MGVIATVAAGSALGGVARYLIGSWAQNGSHAFPWGTLVVNLTGCLVLGILVRWLGDVADSAQWRLFLAIGFCGSYTTFSTFSYEAVQLLRDRDWTAAVGQTEAPVEPRETHLTKQDPGRMCRSQHMLNFAVPGEEQLRSTHYVQRF